MSDLLRIFPLRASPYAFYLTGMFLAQCMLLDTLLVKDLVNAENGREKLDWDSPLMEALHRFVDTHRSALSVFKNGELVGVLTQLDITREICRIVLRGRDA